MYRESGGQGREEGTQMNKNEVFKEKKQNYLSKIQKTIKSGK